jgi:hypothetical protein
MLCIGVILSLVRHKGDFAVAASADSLFLLDDGLTSRSESFYISSFTKRPQHILTPAALR